MSSGAIELFIRFCANTNIDHRNIRDSIIKYVLAYQRNLMHQAAFKVLFGESFINWDYIQRNLPKVDCAHWISIFNFFDFSTVSMIDKSILHLIEKNLVTLNLKDLNIGFHVFLLKNMNFITAQNGLERLLVEHNVPDAYTTSLRFFALSADAAFDLNEMTVVFCHIMTGCNVKVAELEQQIQFVNLKEEELISSFKVKQMRAIGGRPRLRTKLNALREKMSSVVIKKDDFESWGRSIGFPSVFSLHVKHRLYFLMAQVAIPDPVAHIHSITQDVYVCNALKVAHIKTPEPSIIHKAIVAMHLTDEPFKELLDFRCDCLGGFPIVQLQSLLFNDLLHMYVCAYQNSSIWKDVWKMIIPLLSHQVIRDVEAFVQKNPYRFDVVLSIMNNG